MNQTPNNPRMNFVNRLVNQLRPAPGPAYIVQNPYAGTGTLGCQIAGLTGCCNMAA